MSRRLLELVCFGGVLLVLTALQAASAAVTVTRTSAPEFYIDSSESPPLMGQYVAYQITNTGTTIDNAWVEITNFNGGVVSLATNETNLQKLGPLGSGQTKTALFYLTASGATTTSQTHIINVYDGKPPAGSPLAASGDTANTFTVVTETLAASANKVVSVVSGPTPPELGGLLTITVDGDTGQPDCQHKQREPDQTHHH
jgi:hypothetical protein